ncbi:MAG: AMP-dependent synthetase [Ruminococcaceae bacterium]|nr:AMP-dependent synthetase [Oscillospiraceae bacterium]
MKKKEFEYLNPTKFSSIKEMLEIAEREAGDKTAFKYRIAGDAIEAVTYRDFVRRTRAIGSQLRKMGFGDKHIALTGENSYKWITVFLAVINSPGAYVPVDKELPFDDIVRIVNDSDSQILFYSKKFEKELRENTDKFPNIKYYIALDSEQEDGMFLSYDKLVERGEELLDSGYTEYLDNVNDTSEMRLLVYTSGTTGLAKGVMLSEDNMVSCIYHGLRVETIYETCLSVLPYHHTYEAVIGLLVSLHHHSTICINDSLRNTLKNLQEFKPEYIFLVPAFADSFYNRIWASAEKSGKDKMLKVLIKVSNGLMKVGIDLRRKLFKSVLSAFGGELKQIVAGGAPIRPEIGALFNSIGVPLINGYGITECSPLVSVNRLDDNILESVGYPLPCAQVRIDNPEDGIGEICVKSPTVMMGYYKQPEATAAVIKDGWFFTGDYGKIDSEGRIYITGRKKNIIVLTNGKNIYPEEIEEYIMNSPYVSEVVVFSEKNEEGEEIALCAEVFPNYDKIKTDGIENVLETIKAEVKKACAVLPSYKHIKNVTVRETEFEKTTSKKIKRNSVGK